VLVACGGGVGTGGTGAEARGPIVGFGSVIVAGIEFDDSDAVVLDDDGQALSRDGNELRLGMVVAVESSPITGTGDNRFAEASTIRIETAIVGPVGSIDPAARRIDMLGQSVLIEGATVFDAALPNGLSDLQPGTPIAVHGLVAPGCGCYQATRIEPVAAEEPARLRGTVTAIDAAARTLRVGGLVLDYAGAVGAPPGLSVGSTLQLRLALRGGRWAVQSFGAAEPEPPPSRHVEVEGLVTSASDATHFVVDDIVVDAGQAAVVPAGAAPAPGARVVVSGTMNGNVLVAERVRVQGPPDIDARVYKLNGRIASVDTAAGTLVLKKTLVDYSDARFDGGTAAGLAPGVHVKLEGRLSQDGTRLLATQIEFK
jgi:hypothetical protein